MEISAAFSVVLPIACPGAAPDASARGTVHIPKKLADIVVQACNSGVAVPAADSVVIHKFLLCAKWPEGTLGSLELLSH